MECKKQGAKNRIIVIQKEKGPGSLLFTSHILDPSQTDPCFENKNGGCRLIGQLNVGNQYDVCVI